MNIVPFGVLSYALCLVNLWNFAESVSLLLNTLSSVANIPVRKVRLQS